MANMADAIRYGCITRRNCMENTSNYGLKRWDGGDRILHTEFNDNWDKIDTAIKGSADKAAAALAATTALEQKMGWQLLKSTTKILTNGGNHMQLDISNIDLTQYSTLHIRVDVTGNGYLFLGLQNEYLQKNQFSAKAGPICLTLWTMRNGNAQVNGVLCGYNTPQLIGVNVTLQNFKKISLFLGDSGSLTSGTLALYGEV